MYPYTDFYSEVIEHHGIKGQKWGIRRYQNEDGTLTEEGKARLRKYKDKEIKKLANDRYFDENKARIDRMTFDQMRTEQKRELWNGIKRGVNTAAPIAAAMLGASAVPVVITKLTSILEDPLMADKISGFITNMIGSDLVKNSVSSISSDAIKIGSDVLTSPEMEKLITETILTETTLTENIIKSR